MSDIKKNSIIYQIEKQTGKKIPFMYEEEVIKFYNIGYSAEMLADLFGVEMDDTNKESFYSIIKKNSNHEGE